MREAGGEGEQPGCSEEEETGGKQWEKWGDGLRKEMEDPKRKEREAEAEELQRKENSTVRDLFTLKFQTKVRDTQTYQFQPK